MAQEQNYTSPLATYGCFSLLIIIWLRWRRKKMQLFEEVGIPGPPPHFLFGNILEMNRKGLLTCQEEWIQKYGKIVGYYHGQIPVLCIADTDILKKVFIKDFNLFSDRPESVPLRVHSILDYIIPASKIMDSLLVNQKGERWKEVRRILTPTFSANKLKMMIPAVEKVTNVTLSILNKKCQNGELVDIYEILQRLTMDIICAQAFAMDTDVQNKEDDPLMRSAKTIFDLPFSSKIIFFGVCFPELGIIAMAINFLKMFITNGFSIPPLKITEIVGKVMEQRKIDPSLRRPDLLQLLIDATSSDADEMEENASTNSNKNTERFPNKVIKKSSVEVKCKEGKKMTDIEVKANALVVFLAGYETTSSALAFAFYFLGKYPEIQKKIQAEIDTQLENEGQLTYYTANSLQLIERFLLETMRFYPPGINFVSRVSLTDVDYNGLHIPKGIQVAVPVHYMHFSPENWDHPEVFDPDRFLPANRKANQMISYCAFGIGPRNCIGMRLVHITTKLVIAKILQRFTIELAENTISSKLKSRTMVPERVLVKVKPRLPSAKTSE